MDYIINENRNPYYNMAFDEYCLVEMDNEAPVFFLWQNAPTVVIGAHQNVYKEIDLQYLESEGIYLVRRMSGGGAVYHDKGNLNFTFVGRMIEGENEFERCVGYVVEALNKMGVEGVEMSGRNDITMRGMKISGCAKRNYGDRYMVHGTLLYDVDTSVLGRVLNGPQSKLKLRGTDSVKKGVANLRDEFRDIDDVEVFASALRKVLKEMFGGGEEILMSGEAKERVRSIANTKYEDSDWIYGKSIKSNISYVKKFACGTVDVAMMVENNKVFDISFTGDFIGRKRVVELEDTLRGVEYLYGSISARLRTVEVGDYFDRMREGEMVDFLFGK